MEKFAQGNIFAKKSISHPSTHINYWTLQKRFYPSMAQRLYNQCCPKSSSNLPFNFSFYHFLCSSQVSSNHTTNILDSWTLLIPCPLQECTPSLNSPTTPWSLHGLRTVIVFSPCYQSEFSPWNRNYLSFSSRNRFIPGISIQENSWKSRNIRGLPLFYWLQDCNIVLVAI